MSDLNDMFKDLLSCCLHDPQWTPDDVAEEISRVEEYGDYADSFTVIVVKLKSGEFGLLTESADTTGHGCQCGSMTVKEPTLRKLLIHLDEWELQKLIERDGT